MLVGKVNHKKVRFTNFSSFQGIRTFANSLKWIERIQSQNMLNILLSKRIRVHGSMQYKDSEKNKIWKTFMSEIRRPRERIYWKFANVLD